MNLKHIKHTRRIGVAVLVGFALLVGGSVAIAQAQTSNAVYYACVDKNIGTLYALGTTQPTCKRGDSVIDWNQQGPQGSAGPMGPAGPEGPQGPQGPAGVSNYQVVRFTIPSGFYLYNYCQASVANCGGWEINSGALFTLHVDCPTGTTALGGGYANPGSNINDFPEPTYESYPAGSNGQLGSGWTVTWPNPPGSLGGNIGIANPITVYAICAHAN